MTTFKVGDRVFITGKHSTTFAGKTGTIYIVRKTNYRIRIDDYIGYNSDADGHTIEDKDGNLMPINYKFDRDINEMVEIKL